MSFAINVKGGTHAGWKKQKQPREWHHNCRRELTPEEVADQEERLEFVGRYVNVWRKLASYSCPDCGARRPT